MPKNSRREREKAARDPKKAKKRTHEDELHEIRATQRAKELSGLTHHIAQDRSRGDGKEHVRRLMPWARRAVLGYDPFGG